MKKNLLGTVLWIAIDLPLTGILQSTALYMLWSWFMSSQYGTGPTFGAWFGLSVVVDILTRHLMPRDAAIPVSDVRVSALVYATITRWSLLGMVVIEALGVGYLFDWIR